MPDTETIREILLAKQEELRQLDEASAGDSATVELDQQKVGRLSRMDALQAQEMALATKRRREIGQGRIGAALKRLDDGTYGECLACGEEIGEKRLALDPATPTCIDCARKGSAGR
ncbi:MAG: TraR/DksA family transcriptional regulator [Alphaproteobacteria bacterium]